MPTEKLPQVINDYFDLMDGDSKLAVADLFAPDAQVTDNGITYRGDAEIRGWLSGEASQYTITSTLLSAEQTGRRIAVVQRIEGNFPGGRVDLDVHFLLDPADLISTLTITA